MIQTNMAMTFISQMSMSVRMAVMSVMRMLYVPTLQAIMYVYTYTIGFTGDGFTCTPVELAIPCGKHHFPVILSVFRSIKKTNMYFSDELPDEDDTGTTRTRTRTHSKRSKTGTRTSTTANRERLCIPAGESTLIEGCTW